MTTEAQVIAILARQSGVAVSQIGLQTKVASLGLDSLGLVEVVFALGIVAGIETLAPRHVA